MVVATDCVALSWAGGVDCYCGHSVSGAVVLLEFPVAGGTPGRLFSA